MVKSLLFKDIHMCIPYLAAIVSTSKLLPHCVSNEKAIKFSPSSSLSCAAF